MCKSVPCVHSACSLVVVEPLFLLVHQQVGLSLKLTGCEDWLSPQHISCCVGADPSAEDLPQQAFVPVDTILWVRHLWSKSGSDLVLSEASLWV